MVFQIIQLLFSFFRNDFSIISLLPFPMGDGDDDKLKGGPIPKSGLGCAFILMFIILLIIIWLFYGHPGLENMNAASPNPQPVSTSPPNVP